MDKTKEVFERTDLAVVVAEADQWGDFEEQILQELGQYHMPLVVAFNKADLAAPNEAVVESLTKRKIRMVRTGKANGMDDVPVEPVVLESVTVVPKS